MKVEKSRSDAVVSYKVFGGRSAVVLAAQGAILTAAAYAGVAQYAWWIVLVLTLTAAALRPTLSESFMAIRELGIQLEHKGRFRILSDTSRFYPKHSLRAVVINEVFEGYKVNYVLQIVVSQEDEELSLGFAKLRPRLDLLREVWADANDI